MIKVSVIVPVYNGEKYLQECMDSICNQTMREIEIICVDDGSTDSSYDILEQYKAKDERVQILRQQNLYAGTARNAGKAIATGEYLVFWDCDDFYELNALEMLYDRAKEMDADICVCGADQWFETNEKIYPTPGYMNVDRIPEQEVFSRESNEAYILNFTNEATWNKIFRRSFVEERQIDFMQIRNGNDLYFTSVALCSAERITTMTDSLIHHRRNQAFSLVSTLEKAALTPFKAWVDTAVYLREHQIMPEQSFANKAASAMMYLLRNLRTQEAFQEVVTYLREEGLGKLGISIRDDGYYYTAWHVDMIHSMITDEIAVFQMNLMYQTYVQLTENVAERRLAKQTAANRKEKIQTLKSQLTEKKQKIEELKEKLNAQKQKNEQLRNSKTYRIGKAILWLPTKIRNIGKHEGK